MKDLALEAGGRLYLAKDSTLRPSDPRTHLGVEVLGSFRCLKAEVASEGLLTSGLASRTALV